MAGKLGSLTKGDFSDDFKVGLFGFNRKVTRITSAQLLALNATAVSLVPAPGRGRALVMDELRLEYIPGTIEYVSQAGAGAVTNGIVVSVNLTSTTLTIAGQPPFPSYLTFTIVDTTPGIVAGTVTFLGKDEHGNTISEVADVAKTGLTYRTRQIFAYVSSVITAGFTVLGGAGDETIVVGYEPATAEDFAVYYGSLAAGTQARVAVLHAQGFLRGPEAANLGRIVATANLTNTTLTLLAPAAALGTPAQIIVTLVDTTPSLIAGQIAITGTDAAGATQSEVLTFVSGTLSYITARSYLTVTSIVTSGFTVLGGSGDETIRVGTAAGAKIAVVHPESSSIIPIENTALVLAMNTGEIASGNGTVVAEMFYRIVPMKVAT